MAKIILKDGTEEYVAPGVARAKVAAGEASYAPVGLQYPTRMMQAEVVEPVKPKRKRRTKAEIEADREDEPEQLEQAGVDETE